MHDLLRNYMNIILIGIIDLLRDGTITLKELDGFSDGFQEMIDYLLELRNR